MSGVRARYDALIAAGELRPDAEQAAAADALQAVQDALSTGAKPGLLGRLFSARTLPLTRRLADPAVADYLSGLLIGTEIAEAVAAERPTGVVVVGSDALARRYGQALDIAGLHHRLGRPQAAAQGQWRIARAAGLVR